LLSSFKIFEVLAKHLHLPDDLVRGSLEMLSLHYMLENEANGDAP
jgi:hypothetical protein